MNNPQRRKTRAIGVGKLVLGQGNPIRVQSMTSTKTSDIAATCKQIKRLVNAGCEIVRVAVPDLKALKALPGIKKYCPVPLVADIHFQAAYAIAAVAVGVDKIRINPGNIGGLERFKAVIRCCKNKGVAMRIGVNSGSVEKELLEKHSGPTPKAMVESAVHYLSICESLRYNQLVVSIKATHVMDAVSANRDLSEKMDYPIHLGITEAGGKYYGSIKSATGLGALLVDGIGDTIRVSLTGDPVNEIPVAYDILKATGARIVSPEIISCPTCGRLQYNMEKAAAEIEKMVRHIKKPLRIAVMGCVVNGPGEAREADIALAGGKGAALLFIRGKKIKQVGEKEMVREVVRIVEEW
ncbi:MAG: 4-hydroxy-3-methylbut-2-en-1-yl diphosphate synthase [Candidatus Raymondbacteria bacterium RifOxyA12_full_50_37]|uniref:4-hydroxy-3-methylbut-2-en-1-yl diphosphate synthase (flavodoxin) n=1 Tax=Candidatus Raymondbacteria bacterium RIFOXYD12_FULL_49_13 TaxID=1817890 RepID=A0A1F7EZM5_UNCRA|nr:MAG: 4-hydroxy-3-methylbut-2-en-1-yl diphosphate synthase [Candidatus Raymondbacteria bacterium RifOxyA12_full_50_37]OGJ92676.1 MAG: 4-hydroxy-3-methylbut-2-en-1-yl diphosphate synthase [Candidatus Raymondbacteria bacterium RIFOXYA2_FULL_49_16]OGJ99021.1 MAG: 4-hydroxy-3-methylbut-2-en-1-yl diphosphate synthase [Candidatus Raymondbacteria bacterium RIFOXYC2_FULL_50_21]OGJ99389.1 MAG: 4-hydroxy-3-methylbut-2-en-1-yl diphosphate synthase [Candidatus Raymondbacteria bacterium RifOxyB12_full_50_8